jgi:hypothetical protein
LYEVAEQKITDRCPVFKPVSLSDFQIGGDMHPHSGLEMLKGRQKLV